MGAIVATLWILLLNGVVGFQLLDDGTPVSLGLLVLSALALFVGTGYIALDTGFSWTGHFDGSQTTPNRNIGLYVLYQLLPLVCLAGFFLLETILVLRVLGEKKPMRASKSSEGFSHWLIKMQSTFLAPQYYLLLGKSSNMLSAPTSAKKQMGGLMAHFSRLSSLCYR